MSRTKRKREDESDIEEPKRKKQKLQQDYSRFQKYSCCSKCDITRPSIEFSLNRGILRTICRICDAVTSKKNYEKACNFRKQLIRDQGKCGNCCKETMKMDFAHYDRKTKSANSKGNKKGFDFSQMTIAQMIKELPKGRFLCFLCHFKETRLEQTSNLSTAKEAVRSRVKRQKRYDHVNKRKLDDFKECKDCKLCVIKDIEGFFDFDHIDPSTKIDSISKMVADQRPISEIDAEIAKCELTCKDCHYDRTEARRKAKSNLNQEIEKSIEPKPADSKQIDSIKDEKVELKQNFVDSEQIDKQPVIVIISPDSNISGTEMTNSKQSIENQETALLTT